MSPTRSSSGLKREKEADENGAKGRKEVKSQQQLGSSGMLARTSHLLSNHYSPLSTLALDLILHP